MHHMDFLSCRLFHGHNYVSAVCVCCMSSVCACVHACVEWCAVGKK